MNWNPDYTDDGSVPAEEIGWFQLKDGLVAGAAAGAEAYPMWYDPANGWTAYTTAVQTIYSDEKSLPATTKIRAIYDSEAKRWEVLDTISGKALWIKFQVDDAGGLATTDASVSATVVWPAVGNSPAAAESVTVHNLDSNGSGNYVFEGDDNDYGYAMYRPEDDKYYITQMECP